MYTAFLLPITWDYEKPFLVKESGVDWWSTLKCADVLSSSKFYNFTVAS
jgi:hypothetical protein